MIIGLAKEIKNNENRVALTPGGVGELIKGGHTVLVENEAGVGSGFEDSDYIKSGASIIDRKNLFEQAEIIVKVKEPIESEYELFRTGQALYTYLHLAANRPLTEMLLQKKITAIAYETVQLPSGQLPLLTPMSEVAGRMAVQIGASLLQKNNGGRGVLLGGIPGVSRGEVVIVGGGMVGTNAAKMAVGLGANVTILDVSKQRLAYLDDLFKGSVTTLIYNEFNVAEAVKRADLLIGAVLVAGAKAPKTVTETMVRSMAKGSVIVDVAIDQGGSIETVDRITTHDNPFYVKHDVLHYSVANMPGAVPRTSTFALESATLPYLVQLANKGVKDALLDDESLLSGLNTYAGNITYKPVAEAMNVAYVNPKTLLTE